LMGGASGPKLGHGSLGALANRASSHSDGSEVVRVA
jgi:hypothetical protein